MKKIMFALAIAIIATATQATSVMWKFTGTSSQEGWQVYAMTALPEKIEALSDISSTSSGKVAKEGRVYFASGTLDGFAEASGKSVDYYLVLTGSKDGEDYYYSISQAGTTFDATSTDVPVQAEYNGSKIGAIGSEGWTKISGATPPGPGGDVPEPTSGLLLALGGAALALRRKQK